MSRQGGESSSAPLEYEQRWNTEALGGDLRTLCVTGTTLMMEVGILQFTMRFRGCRSLKQKRRVVRSIKDRFRSRYNVSIAEVDDLDVWQVGTLGLAMCGNDSKRIVAEIQKLLDQLRAHPDAELIDHRIDIL